MGDTGRPREICMRWCRWCRAAHFVFVVHLPAVHVLVANVVHAAEPPAEVVGGALLAELPVALEALEARRLRLFPLLKLQACGRVGTEKQEG